MRLRGTIILLVVAAILVGYYVLVEQPRHRRSQQRAVDLVDLAAMEIGDAAAVVIKRPDITLAFERRDDGWRMTSPLSDLAADGSVNRLVGILAEGEIDRDIGPQDDLSPFGLDTPAAVITITKAEGDTAVCLEVGDYTVDDYSAYARSLVGRKARNVILVPTGVRRYALAETSEFRSKRVVDFESRAVESFTLRWEDRSTTWHREGENDWSTEKDGRVIRGRNELIATVVRSLRGLRVREFVPEREIPLIQPFDAPERSVKIALAGGLEQTVRAGRRREAYVYALSRLRDDVDERVVLADSSLLTILRMTTSELRDRRLLRFDRANVRKITVESPDFRATLVRPGSEWTFPNPALDRPDQHDVRRVISDIAALEYSDVVDEDPGAAELYGLSNPDLSLTLFDEAGSPIDRLVCKLNSSDPSSFIATSRYAGLIAEVARQDLDALIDRIAKLRKP